MPTTMPVPDAPSHEPPHEPWPGMPSPAPAIGMAQWMRERALRSGGRSALSFEGQTWSFDALQSRIEQAAAVLALAGVGPRTRVAYLGLNHPMFLVTLFATARLGAVFVPLNFRLSGPELQYIINDADVHTLVAAASHHEVLAGVRADLCCSAYWNAEGQATAPAGWPDLPLAMQQAPAPAQPPFEPLNDDVVVIMYTSGTTGRPKGTMLTCGNFWWNHVGELYSVDILADDRLLVFAPLFHIGGLNVLTLSTLLKGGHVVLHRSFDAERALDCIAREAITTVFAVPAMLLFMSQSPRFAQADLSSLRLILCGGAPCPEPLLRLFGERSIAIQQGYGLTETAALASVLAAEYALTKLGSVGHAALLTQVRLIDAQGHTLTAPLARGEVCVRGPNVARGYWKQPEATRQAFGADGWFRTGDVGYRDADGFLYICDRVKDMIISGGENVYPAEVESVLSGHPAIAEVAVVGAPDAQWGETVVAVVALKPGLQLQLQALQDFAGARLARYKMPRRLHLVDALPRNPTGKILKYQIRHMLAQDSTAA